MIYFRRKYQKGLGREGQFRRRLDEVNITQEGQQEHERALEQMEKEIDLLSKENKRLRAMQPASIGSQSVGDLMTFRDSGYESHEAEAGQPRTSTKTRSYTPIEPQMSRITSGRLEQKNERLKEEAQQARKERSKAEAERDEARDEIARITRCNEAEKKAAVRERDELTAQKKKAESEKQEAESAKVEAKKAQEETEEKLQESK
ncbi:MAG: hypothetical protein Q9218_005327, partial [Villophora microphyllina]